MFNKNEASKFFGSRGFGQFLGGRAKKYLRTPAVGYNCVVIMQHGTKTKRGIQSYTVTSQGLFTEHSYISRGIV